jgi:hypothetical protein
MKAGAMGVLLCAGLAAAQPPAGSDSCALSGRVVNSETGEGIRKAEVIVSDQENHENWAPLRSGESGNFECRGLKPGRYGIHVRHPSFVRQSQISMTIGGISSSTITLAAG